MPVISATSTSSVKRNDNGVSYTRTSVTSSVTSLTEIDLKAIAAFEDAIIKGLDLTQNKDETRSAFIGRCLLAKGTAALSIAVKGPGGVLLWHKAYGVKRNTKSLEPSISASSAVFPPPWIPLDKHAEYIVNQNKLKHDMMQQSRQDTLASLGLSSSSLSVTFATCFQAASISKPISAMAVMRLVQRGVLDLDTDIHEYLKHSNDTEEVAEKGEWKLPVSLPDGIVGVKTPITLRLLFGHAAGTSVWGFDGYNRKQVREGKLKVPSTLGILKGEGNSPKVELNCVPNTVHQYSGGGTTIIQFVVKRVTGKPFWKVIEEEVVVPLKLEHTVVTLEDSPNGGDFACGHMFSDCIPVPGGYHLYPESAAAGVWTTPMDICKIQTALFKSFCGETIDGKMFLAKDLAKEMVTPRFAASSGACLGIGWMMPEVPNREFAHGGMNEGYVCDTFTLLESGAGITWMASSERQSFEVMNEASKAIGQVYGFGEWQQQETTTQPEEEVPASLDECVGNFQLVVPDTLFDADFVGPVIRVERSLKPRDGKNSLDFCFESLEGRVSCSSHDSDDAFRFQVMPRMDAKFVKARGKTTLQFGRNVFVQE